MGLSRQTLLVVAVLEARSREVRGLICWQDAAAEGLSAAAARILCRDNRWRRVADGVYAVVAIRGGPLQQAAADLMAAGVMAFVQRRTAAVVHGRLDLPWPRSIDIAVPREVRSRRYPRRTVPPQHIVEVDGLRTTDLLLTILDLAVVTSDIEWEWALEAVLRTRKVCVADIEAALAAPGRKHPPSVARVERVLALRPTDAPPTGSGLETRFIQLCRKVGAPEPERQRRIVTAGGFPTFPDLSFPPLGLFIELDGQQHKGQPIYDARRETAIVAATGWLCGRFTWTEVVDNPTPTGRRLLALLDQARRRPLPST